MKPSVNTSATVGEIQAAIVAAQSSGLMAVATRENSALSSGNRKAMYADFTDVVLAIQPKLSAQGLGFMQLPGIVRYLGEGDMATLVCACTTRIIHKSGEFIECEGEFMTRPPNRPLNWSQAQGLAQGYAKRQSLMAVLGIPSGDERDAEELSAALANSGQEPTYTKHWSELIKGAWDGELVEGYKVPLGEMSDEEKAELVRQKIHLKSPALTACLWDRAIGMLESLDPPQGYDDAPGTNWPADFRDLSHEAVKAFFNFAKLTHQAAQTEAAP